MSCSVQHRLVVAWPVLDAITDVPIGCAPWSMPSHPTVMKLRSWWSNGVGVVHVEHIHVLGD